MSYLRSIAILILSLSLTACFEVDIATQVNDDKTVTVTSVLEITRQLYDMQSEEDRAKICGAVTSELGDTNVTCREERTVGLGVLSTLLTNADSESALDIDARATEVSPGVVRVTFDLQNVRSGRAFNMKVGGSKGDGGDQEVGTMLANREIKEGMKELIAAAFAGRSLALSVAGNEIVGTNGAISDDDKSANLIVPLVDILKENVSDLPDQFYADVRVKSCRLWIICT